MGEVWSDPALDRRTRSLEVVAMLAALGGRPGPLRSHLNGALNHGARPEEVVQTLRMVAVYAGFPAALEAWPIMEAVFAERGIARPGSAR
jgi:4-carboxymuconolactone decarboxylase